MLYFCSYKIFIMLALGLFSIYEGNFKPGLERTGDALLPSLPLYHMWILYVNSLLYHPNF